MHRLPLVIAVSVVTAVAGQGQVKVDPRLPLDSLPVVARIELPSAADWMALGFGSMWVVNYRPSRVSRIDTSTNRVTADIALGPNGCLGIVATESRVFVPTCGDGVVNEIDPVKDSVVRRIAWRPRRQSHWRLAPAPAPL